MFLFLLSEDGVSEVGCCVVLCCVVYFVLCVCGTVGGGERGHIEVYIK